PTSSAWHDNTTQPRRRISFTYTSMPPTFGLNTYIHSPVASDTNLLTKSAALRSSSDSHASVASSPIAASSRTAFRVKRSFPSAASTRTRLRMPASAGGIPEQLHHRLSNYAYGESV